MMGQKDFAPKLFHSLSLSKLVPEEHLVRQLEEVFDLGFVRKLCAPFYSHTGQPSVDPVVVFKMLLLGYFYGITSERRLAEECSLHLAFRWYLGYDLDEPTPNHSILSKARTRYGRKVFEQFFAHVLQRCVQAGLMRGERLFADSTLIEANASGQSLENRESDPRPAFKPSEYVDKVFAENPGEAGQESVASPISSVEQEIADRKSQWTKGKSTRGRKPSQKRRLNLWKISKTDADAALVRRPGMKAKLAYKSHFTVDGAHRIITAVTVTAADVEDSSQVSRLLDQQPFTPKFFCADSHYGVARIYEEVRRRGITPIIPRRSSHTQKPKAGRIPLSEFHYDAREDIYRCPQGQTLKRTAYDARWDRYHYRPKQSDCKGCPVRLACTTATGLKTIVRSPYENSLSWALSKLKSPVGKEIFQERCSTAEWVVAEAKNFHGLRRAQHRGSGKVFIQVLMTAAVQNLKRLLRRPLDDTADRLDQLIRILFQPHSPLIILT